MKYGIVGYGPRANRLRNANKSMELEVVFDPSPKAQESIQKLGVKCADSYDDLLSSDIDAVIIGSPPQFHADQSIKALNADKHVLCEVPFAIKEEEIDKIIDADEANPKCIFMLGENTCFDADVLYEAYMVTSGKLGPVVYGEQEYINDVSYRWRGRGAKEGSPRYENWYSLFDPLAYAHSILPGSVAMGGLRSPVKFVEVESMANDIGAQDPNDPVCKPSKAFHVALFKTAEGAILKCIAAYVHGGNGRSTSQVLGRFGHILSESHGVKAHQFMCDGFNLQGGSRKGSRMEIGMEKKKGDINKFLKDQGFNIKSREIRMMNRWINAINGKEETCLAAKDVSNACLAGLMASKSARTGEKVDISKYQ